MRIAIATLLVAAGLAGCTEAPKPAPPAPVVVARPKPPTMPPTQAPICARPAEKVAFAMAALRMQLSVTELSCDGREQFNAFTNKFKTDVAAQNKTLGGFFSRAYGKRGQAQQDEYETSQINQMSQAGTYYGADFCGQALPMYADVLALKNSGELDDYAVKQNFDQVLQAPECAETPAAPAKGTAKSPAKGKPAAKR